MSKSTIVSMTGYLEYARIFPENIDNHEMHEKTQGQFNVNFYPENEAEVEKYYAAGAPKQSMGYPTFKNGSEYGTGQYTKLKRPNVHPKFDNWVSAPLVFDFRNGESTKQWNFEEDGEIGNGSKAIVKVSVYGEGSTAIRTLERVAILELVPYERAEFDGVERF